MKPRRAPADWKPSGPQPTGGDDVPSADEELSYLSGDWRIFQVKQGHRWSLDDLVTAYVATREAPWARAALDLGCGLGSVLLLCAWKLPGCRFTGVEAQTDRAAMARRSIRWNGVEDRCRVLDGDFRDGVDGEFDLITGTPPYFPPGTGTTSAKPHAEACRFELRGGVEAYVETALPRLNRGGALVLCGTRSGIARPALRLEVIPKVGKAPLFTVEVARPDSSEHREEQLTVRDADDQWTQEFRAVRAAMGMPSRPPG
ncbi:MAG: methyltransferase [Archangiaceae bacterium]|nr:methyltransferase [Archangiaceae bacterium]